MVIGDLENPLTECNSPRAKGYIKSSVAYMVPMEMYITSEAADYRDVVTEQMRDPTLHGSRSNSMRGSTLNGSGSRSNLTRRSTLMKYSSSDLCISAQSMDGDHEVVCSIFACLNSVHV